MDKIQKIDKVMCGATTQSIPEEVSNFYFNNVFSRLLADRIIYIGDAIDEELSNTVIAQLLYLDNASKTHEPINMYINTPGGSVSDGLAIYDTMRMIKSPIITTCVGMCASMGAILLSAGEKGSRRILKHSRVMIHQPSGGGYGTCDDVEIRVKLLADYKRELYEILAENTGKTPEEIIEDSKRDMWLNAEDALKYGIVDKII